MFSLTTKLYPITDVQLSALPHACQVEELSEGGAMLVQLREKRLPPREFYQQAQAVMQLARARGIRVIINDRVDIALALHADGVHLGQDDLPPEAARRLLGERFVIGFSTHNLEQARTAAKLPIDYVAIGPVFTTSTKANHDPVVGLAGLRRVREVTGELPLVAIGGITQENAAEVIAAGADAVAVVSALLGDGTIARRTRDFLGRL